MTDDAFQTMAVPEVQRDLDHLRRRVAGRRGRVEFGEGEDRCVIISKAELEGMERTIQLLGSSPDMKRLCAAVSQLAHEACLADRE